MKELKNWKEVSKGYYRYVISANAAYEIFIEYWGHGTPIETAKASLCIVCEWHKMDGSNTTEREWLGKELPVQELLGIAHNDNEKCNTTGA